MLTKDYMLVAQTINEEFRGWQQDEKATTGEKRSAELALRLLTENLGTRLRGESRFNYNRFYTTAIGTSPDRLNHY